MRLLVAALAGPLLLLPAMRAQAQPGTAAPPSPVNPSQISRAEIGFSLYALGAKGMDMQLTLRRDTADVQVELAMRTAGMVDWAMRMVMTGQSAARIGQDGRLQPVRYITDSDGTWSKRVTRMSWGADGLPVAEVFPPNDEDDREEVPDLLKRDTLDPTMALVSRVLRGGATPPCEGSDAIYDGRRRYNMHFAPLGPETLKAHNRTSFSGVAFKCLVKLEPVAGYSRKYMAEWSEKDEQPTHIWLAQPPGFDVWLPVQMEGSSRMATATSWITSAKLNGQDWLKPVGFIRVEVPTFANQ
ncbi:MAG: DUF3108 domain-containing protein [Ferrovibrio sp.]